MEGSYALSPQVMEERYYQTDAVDAAWNFIHEKPTGDPLICMPTGTGKSQVINRLSKRIIFTYPQTRLLMVTHVKELIKQNASSLLRYYPAAPLGIYSAGLDSRDTAQPIVFGGVQSMVNNIRAFGKRGVMLIDEAHLVPPNQSAMYQALINGLREINPFLRIIGLTATPWRTGSGSLAGPGQIFSDICYDITGVEAFNKLIREGYLCPLVSPQTRLVLNVEGVGSIQGDYNKGQLEAAVDKEKITREALTEACEFGRDRRSWLVFASGVNHAEHIAQILNEYGISAVAVHGDTKRLSSKDRDARIKAYKNGDVRAIVNFNVLTTGFDDPKTDMIVMLRPTQSAGLWVQMLGRGTRPSILTGKRNCLVLDFARNVELLGPINDPVIPMKKRKNKSSAGSRPVPIKICKIENTIHSNPLQMNGCGNFNHIQARFCSNCENEFLQAVKIDSEASTKEFIKQDTPDVPIIETLDVALVLYAKHAVAGKVPCMKVSYAIAGQLKPIVEWVHLESPQLRNRAVQWWMERHQSEAPNTIDEALQYQRQLRKPNKIRVWQNPPEGYPRIMRHEY